MKKEINFINGTFSDNILENVNNGNPIEDIFEEDFDKIQFIDNIDEIRFVRVDKLLTEKRKELQNKGIYDGIVKFEIKNKVVINITPIKEMPSQIIERELIR